MNFPEALRIVCDQCGRAITGCKTCPVLQAVADYDTAQYVERQLNLIRSMTIKPVNNWFVGTISGYRTTPTMRRIRKTIQRSLMSLMTGLKRRRR